MLTNATAEKLYEMKLGVMATQFKEQLKNSDISTLSFEERFGLLVDAEYIARKGKRLARLIKSAGYAFPNACLEDVEYHADRELDKAMLTRLGTCKSDYRHFKWRFDIGPIRAMLHTRLKGGAANRYLPPLKEAI